MWPYLMPSMFEARDSGLRTERVLRHCRRCGRIPVVSGLEFGVGQPKLQSSTVLSPSTC